MTPSAQHDEPNTRLKKQEGRIYLSGMQALIRLMIDQSERDRKSGLRTGGFVSGYPGSPLGGLEGSLKRASALLEKHRIKHLPGQNEELAATALMGTQMLDEYPHPDFDGVVAYWYGKGPGVDRASDAFKHGNFAGTSKHGAVVVLSGEDHEAKSSTVPYQQEFAFEHFGMPIIQPASTLEILTLGAHAVALSRYSGCWVAMKLTAPVCDSGDTIDLSKAAPTIHLPAGETGGTKTDANFRFFPIVNIARERDLYYSRHAAVQAYARANGLDQITVKTDNDRIGIISSGKSSIDTQEALHSLGYDDEALKASGIRLLKIGLLYPLEPEIIKQFAAGLDQIIVIEEKRDFLERQVAGIICNLPRVPKLLGKRDLNGAPLFPIEGGMDFDLIARLLGQTLNGLVDMPGSARPRLDELFDIEQRSVAPQTKRMPTYCSGCPHNIGTKLAPGQIAWGAPGCHVFAAIMPEPTRRIEAVTQFGGEGLPWIGLSPFTSRSHIVQNVGDGSLFHSSYLNIRFAVSAGINITFKILYNGAIANTGGQPPVGAKSIPELTQLLAIEGVRRIVLVTKDVDAYRGASLSRAVEIRRDEDIETVQTELAKTPGVTVLIYDGQCANEQRRRRKRALLPPVTRFTIVNEEVCENCGHCGQVSSCMSLHKVDTEFGKKTTIHQSSCNHDMTCLRAECPSFLTVEVQPGAGLKKISPPKISDAELPGVTLPTFERSYQICMPGVGGTGVITLNAILAQAASLDGLRAISFDLTGSAQKWGPVLSSLIIARDDAAITTNHVGRGRADLFLALDLLASSDQANLGKCAPRKTVAVVNESVLPTGEMIRNVDLTLHKRPMVEAILSVSDRRRSVVIDAGAIAEKELGDYMLTNMVSLGAAFQAGLVPISAASIEQAIRQNDTQVEQNIAAFRIGRLYQAAPHKSARTGTIPQLADRAKELELTPSAARDKASNRLMASFADLPRDLREKLSLRVEDLICYQNEAYAERYARFVQLVAEKERAVTADDALRLTQAVTENLHKLMAYKDEYEVARLLTQRTFRERAKSMFEGQSHLYFHLQPPLLRHFGVKRKFKVGEWFILPLSLLYKFRFLRGTPFDIFGYAAVRRTERELADWYMNLVRRTCNVLTAETLGLATDIARLPEQVRGYEDIKLSSVPRVRAKADELYSMLSSASLHHNVESRSTKLVSAS